MKYRISSYACTVICFFLLATATTIFMASNISYNRYSEKLINFDNKNIDSIYLRVSDVYGKDGQKSLAEFFAEKDALSRMKQFCNILKSEFNYLEIDNQNLLIKDKLNYKDEFRVDYATSGYGANDDIGVSLKSIQIGESAFASFGLQKQLYEGENLKTNDFVFENNKNIPAILGYEYKGLINIGDTIKVNYLSKDVTLVVSGFFQKETYVTINNKIYFLDQYITFPSLDIDANFIPTNEEDERFQNILYSLKTWGYIKVADGDNYYDYKNKVDTISSELNLKYALNEGYTSQYIRNISNTIDSSKGIFLITSIFLYLLMSAVYIYIYIWNYNKSKGFYAIHLICGCSILKIKIRAFVGILIQSIVSIGVASVINSVFSLEGNIYQGEQILFSKSVGQTVLFSSIVVLIICLILNVYISKSDVYSAIRKEN